MRSFPDISEWYTPERIDAEEPFWKDGAAYREFADRILKTCRSNGLKTIIEVGCGTGWVPSALDVSLDYLAGIDKNPHMIARSKSKNPTKRFIQCDIRDLHTLNVSADLVCSFEVLKHFSLSEWNFRLKDILALGKFGLFTLSIVVDGRASFDLPGEVGEGFHGIWLTPDDVVRAIQEAGHRVVEMDSTYRFDEGVGSPLAMFTTERTKQ